MWAAERWTSDPSSVPTSVICGFWCQQVQHCQGTKDPPAHSQRTREEVMPENKEQDRKKNCACCQVPAAITAKESLKEGNKEVAQGFCRYFRETASKYRGKDTG